MAQVCNGLQAAHDRGVVHRDLEPANIFLTHEDGLERFVRLLDFGIVKLADDDGTDVHTRTGQVFGTISYMAPEQALGANFVPHRADIFALGVITYQLLAGVVPYSSYASPPSSSIEPCRTTRPCRTGAGYPPRVMRHRPRRPLSVPPISRPPLATRILLPDAAPRPTTLGAATGAGQGHGPSKIFRLVTLLRR
jgi:serine/threonine protein kinase